MLPRSVVPESGRLITSRRWRQSTHAGVAGALPEVMADIVHLNGKLPGQTPEMALIKPSWLGRSGYWPFEVVKLSTRCVGINRCSITTAMSGLLTISGIHALTVLFSGVEGCHSDSCSIRKVHPLSVNRSPLSRGP